MKKQKQILFMAFFFISIIFLLNSKCYAGTQRLNNLNYDVKINSDGSMDVTETWDIYISETNTLFKDFNLDNDKYSGITNVEVKDVTSNRALENIAQEMYHVTKDCFYALETSDDTFEIAWGVGLDDSSATRTYQLSYTVLDVITQYEDCNELYWMFVDSSNGIPAQNVTGNIKLPKSVGDLEKLRVWAHGPLNGEIHKTSKDTVNFEVKDFSSKTMLEVRIVTEENIYDNVLKYNSYITLNDILLEEQEWADEANAQRREAKLRLYVEYLIYGIIILFFFSKILKYNKQLKEIKENSRPGIDIGKYFRDIPREKEATPAEAAYLYYSKNNNFNIGTNVSKVFSATLLQLCLKGYLTFDVEDKKNIKINFTNKDLNESKLKLTEKGIFDLLKKVSKNTNEVSMKELKKYAGIHYEEINKIMNGLSSKAEDYFRENNYFDKETEELYKSFKVKSGVYWGLFYFSIMFGIGIITFLSPLLTLITFIEIALCAILSGKCASKIKILTEKGELERKQWQGLKKYMEEFSLLKDKEIPDLVLWEKYLIYATGFGIADKVIKQLKLVYPNFDEYSNQCTYMYLMRDNSFGHNFLHELNHGVDSAYSSYKSAYDAAHSSSSSGSGGGGGFSGGGGGRRWRWPEWAEDDGEKYENRN